MTEPRFLVTVSFVHDVEFNLPVLGETFVLPAGGALHGLEVGLTDYVWLAGLPGKLLWHVIPVTAFPSHSPN